MICEKKIKEDKTCKVCAYGFYNENVPEGGHPFPPYLPVMISKTKFPAMKQEPTQIHCSYGARADQDKN